VIALAWSYDVDQVHVNPKDKVRFLVGDTHESEPLVQDEEILAALEMANGNVLKAAALVCDSLAAHFSRQVDKTTGAARSALSQRAKAYAERAKELRQQAKQKIMASAKPFAGGLSLGEKQLAAQNTDRVGPFFTRNWPST